MIDTTVQTSRKLIPLRSIITTEQPYFFRDAELNHRPSLKEELSLLGLLNPLVLEERAENQFILIDGHMRFNAISEIQKEKGGWDEIHAVVVSSSENTIENVFRHLIENNLKRDRSYSIFDLAHAIVVFIEKGLSHTNILKVTQFSQTDLNHLLIISKSPLALRKKLSSMRIRLSHVATLAFKYQKWMQSPYALHADVVVDKLLDHLNSETISDRRWEFLLNFYWDDKRPFMAPPKNRS